MMRRSAGFDANEAWRQLLKEWQNVTALELTANDDITCRINSVDLKNRLSDIETDGRDRLHVWLLRIVGALTAPTSMALPCRWRSRPQHQKRTRCAAIKLCFDQAYEMCRHCSTACRRGDVALAGLTSTATRAAPGTNSRRSSSRFATNSPLRIL